MQYSVIHIHTSFAEEWQKDLFDQQLCDLGIDTIDGEDYYIPSDLWQQNQTAITDYLSTSGLPFTVSEVPDENWNAVWEAEHPVQELPLGVKIIPHCAFGAGHHETTSMMIDTLINYLTVSLSNGEPTDGRGTRHQSFNVLDHGCGTGVLAIFAKKLGATHVLAIDIDDKSVANTLENAALNGVEIDARLGDTIPTPLCGELEKGFDLILANIHRNVLLSQMPQYARHLCPGGELWLSGFYEEDCPSLISSAVSHGLRHLATRSNGDWRMLRFKK